MSHLLTKYFLQRTKFYKRVKIVQQPELKQIKGHYWLKVLKQETVM